MRYRQLVPVLFVVAAACKKDDAAPTPPITPSPSSTISDFSLLETGNYWVYQRSALDTAGNVSNMTSNMDSLFISGTTEMNGNTWAILSKALNGTVIPGMEELRRDSADCVVDGNGEIVFRYGVFDQPAFTTVEPTVFEYDWYVSGVTTPITVPAGTFDAHALNCEVTQVGPLVPPPSDRDFVSWWASGTGKVRDDQYYYSSGTGVRRDLVRYLVQ